MISEKMWAKTRKAIEKLYTDICKVYEYRNGERNPVTGISLPSEEVLVIENQLCRLSTNSSPAASKSDDSNNVIQVIKLFIAPELDIKAGSKIFITRQGVTREYKRSGVAALYKTHQEIILELAQEKA